VDLEHGRLPDPVVKAISEAFARQTRLEERVRVLERRLAQTVPETMAQTPRGTLEDSEVALRVRDVLREVIDPEVGMSLPELGFVRDVAVAAKQVRVALAIPEPECPFMEYFVDQIRRKVKGLDGIERVEVTFVDVAPWPERRAASLQMKEKARHG
jgi:metal-sulfur cluster biosynthetic enzyme